MKIINENDLTRVDLNLLVLLLVMYETRSVTRAAQRLYLGQHCRQCGTETFT
ncbi:hypothetical protein [Pantoea sp.]|uniref:hypothetical protein n=1 Tax=Pantoea sp. TaxID=69393 RepID=UPI0028ACAF12|nr:hypothetical protein [Pantoea sp.]